VGAGMFKGRLMPADEGIVNVAESLTSKVSS